jgi:hypothetical protein
MFLSAPVVNAALLCGVAADEFGVTSYSNQDGNGVLNWTSDWIETGDGSGASGDDFRVTGGILKINSDCCAGGNPNDSVEREIDLSAYSGAQLRVSVYRSLFGLSQLQLEISNNGGSSWTNLETFSTGGGAGYFTYIYDISPYIASNTRIRFRNTKGGSGLDWIGVNSVEVRACNGSEAASTYCDQSFPDGASIHDAAGEVTFLDNSQVKNSPDGIIDAPSVNIVGYTADTLYGTYTCDAYGHCAASGSTSPTINPGAFPSWAASVGWNPDFPATHSGEGFIGEQYNRYNTIQVDAGTTAVVSDKNFQTFYIKDLQMEVNSRLYLPPGDYYIDDINHIYSGAQIVLPDDGTVRIFVNKSFTVNSANALMNATSAGGVGNPENLVLYGYNNITVDSGSQISGYIYTVGWLTLSSNASTTPQVYGAVTGGDVYLGTLSRISYNAVGLTGVNFGGMCPVSSIDHYKIDHSGNGVTCETVPVTITAHQASHALYSTGGQTITLSTSTGNGTWILISGSGVLTDGTADDGAAAYTFAAGESSVQLGFQNTNVEVLSINVSDGAATEGGGSEDPNLDMATSGLVLWVDGAAGNIGSQIAGKATSIASSGDGAAVTLSARVVTTDGTTGACTARLPAGNHDIEFAYECNSPGTCQAVKPGEINHPSDNPSITTDDGTYVTDVAGNSNGSVSTYTAVTLPFDGSATANYVMNYNDAGQVTLHARVVLPATATEPALTLTQSTNSFVVRPFGIAMSDIEVSGGGAANPAKGADQRGAGDQFMAAGEEFDYKLGAYLYSPADVDLDGRPDQDDDLDGLPDPGVDLAASNPIAANFTATAAITHTKVSPTTAGSVDGTLGDEAPKVIASGGGLTLVEDQSWDEVGSISLAAAVTDYLGSGMNLNASSEEIGRFYPASFVLATNTLKSKAYMGQDLGLNVTLQAVNAGGAVVNNLDFDDAADGATIDYALGSLAFVAENNNSGDGGVLSGNLSGFAGVWENGSYNSVLGTPGFAPVNAFYTRPAAATLPTLNGPASALTSLQLGLTLTGWAPTPVIAGGTDMNAATSVDCIAAANCDAYALGAPVDMRYGRVHLATGLGSEDAGRPLELQFEMQSWDAAQRIFVKDVSDDATVFYNPAASPAVEPVLSGAPTLSNYTGELAAGEIMVTNPVVTATPFTDGQSPGGNGTFVLSNTPGYGNNGSVTVTFGQALVADWAEFDHNGDGNGELTTVVTFGESRRGHDRIIQWQED